MSKLVLVILIVVLLSCAPHIKPAAVFPAYEYSKSIKAQMQAVKENVPYTGLAVNPNPELQYVSSTDSDQAQAFGANIANEDPVFETYESEKPNIRDYNGPLSLGDPGMTASLWKESKGGTDLFHDDRAWQPMDLVTIVVSERSKGSKQADTEVKGKSTVQAAIEHLLGFEEDIQNELSNGDTTPVDMSSLVQASTTNDFKGEGETTREGELTAKISAMVVEVMPSGILRIEGQKIIAVNSEEQVMVISGLIRPRDINSINEVDSSKIAQMRIDYYGKGVVGEAQSGGWLSRIMRVLWPF